jgi:hypothetical protein
VIFLLIFSYVLLCDFVPLYDFQTDACGPAIEPERLKALNTEDNLRTINTANSSEISSNSLQRRDRPSNTEYALAFWVFTIFCEEIRQVN